MWILLLVLALTAVEAELYQVPQIPPQYPVHYSPPVSWPIYNPWPIYGHPWWSYSSDSSESRESSERGRHHRRRSSEEREPAGCARCTRLFRDYTDSTSVRASIEYNEESDGCIQAILGCPVSNGSYLYVKEANGNITNLALGFGIKVQLECSRFGIWTPYTIPRMNIITVGCRALTEDETKALLNGKSTESGKKQNQLVPAQEEPHKEMNESVQEKLANTALNPAFDNKMDGVEEKQEGRNIIGEYDYYDLGDIDDIYAPRPITVDKPDEEDK